MYRVSYINSNGIINHKVCFATEIEARKWIEENKEQNKILKLLVMILTVIQRLKNLIKETIQEQPLFINQSMLENIKR